MKHDLLLSVDIPSASTELKENLTHSLKQEIELLGQPENIQEIKVTQALPKGAMPAEAFTLGGALLLAVLPQLLPKIAEIIRDFKLRNNQHNLKIVVRKGENEISVEMPAGTKPEDIDQLTDMLTKKLG